jgi:S1-C subfamily serine protease
MQDQPLPTSHVPSADEMGQAPALPDGPAPVAAMPAGLPIIDPPALPHSSGERSGQAAASAEPAPAGPSVRQRGLWSLLLPLSAFVAVLLLAAYAAPMLLLRWRLAEAEGEAEAAYLRRQGELKAEAESADKRLSLLDRRMHLVSLGFREMVRKVTPTVVNITSFTEPADGLTRHRLRFDVDNQKHYLQAGVGSGVIARPGLVLTNAHVVRQARRLRVTFASGRSIGVDADAVSADTLTDLAILRLPSAPSVALAEDYRQVALFADSDRDVERGDLVVALGSPFGLNQTVTHGIISAKGRLVNSLDTVDLLQTDAPINPGNSGGPLFDQYGRVIGINFAIASETGGNQGIGFVIPSNTAQNILAKLAAQGKVVRGFVGAVLEEVLPEEAMKLGLAGAGGVRIVSVAPGFPAARGGLKAGDVVVRYKNQELGGQHAARELRQRILETQAGSAVPVEVLREGGRQTLTLEIGERPPTLP